MKGIVRGILFIIGIVPASNAFLTFSFAMWEVYQNNQLPQPYIYLETFSGIVYLLSILALIVFPFTLKDKMSVCKYCERDLE